ncbi:hypothetical protein L596_002171 [Steinernema carpocapsae]|uniref:Uncharacterized protein n=1 Tax=Steinernema carpocapsae TaxID=34508 RepID=A0A4U8USE1_STECR|nr:hypothetical protein L596_002171 [Steinernema carpocapsae]
MKDQNQLVYAMASEASYFMMHAIAPSSLRVVRARVQVFAGTSGFLAFESAVYKYAQDGLPRDAAAGVYLCLLLRPKFSLRSSGIRSLRARAVRPRLPERKTTSQRALRKPTEDERRTHVPSSDKPEEVQVTFLLDIGDSSFNLCCLF